MINKKTASTKKAPQAIDPDFLSACSGITKPEAFIPFYANHYHKLQRGLLKKIA